MADVIRAVVTVDEGIEEDLSAIYQEGRKMFFRLRSATIS
jgi:hypothetical protein